MRAIKVAKEYFPNHKGKVQCEKVLTEYVLGSQAYEVIEEVSMKDEDRTTEEEEHVKYKTWLT